MDTEGKDRKVGGRGGGKERERSTSTFFSSKNKLKLFHIRTLPRKSPNNNNNIKIANMLH